MEPELPRSQRRAPSAEPERPFCPGNPATSSKGDKMKGIVHRGLLAVAPVLLGMGCRAERMTQPPPGSVVRRSTIEPAAATGAQGTVWAWGVNLEGELGNGTNTTTFPFGLNTPGPVSGLTG